MQPLMAKTFSEDWLVTLVSELIRLPITLAYAISAGHWLALAIVILSGAFILTSALRAEDQSRRVALLAVAFGLLLCFSVLTVAGYFLYPVGHFSRTFVAANVWISAFAALSWQNRPSTGWLRLAMKGGVATLFIILAISTVAQDRRLAALVGRREGRAGDSPC